MENEEEDNLISNSSLSVGNDSALTATAAEFKATESPVELHEPEPELAGGDYGVSQPPLASPPTSPQSEKTVLDADGNQHMVAGEGLCVNVTNKVEVIGGGGAGGGGECDLAELVLVEPPVSVGGGSEVGETQGIEESRDLIVGEEGEAVNREIDGEREVVGDVVEEAAIGEKVKRTVKMEELEMADEVEGVEKREVAEETNEEAGNVEKAGVLEEVKDEGAVVAGINIQESAMDEVEEMEKGEVGGDTNYKMENVEKLDAKEEMGEETADVVEETGLAEKNEGTDKTVEFAMDNELDDMDKKEVAEERNDKKMVEEMKEEVEMADMAEKAGTIEKTEKVEKEEVADAVEEIKESAQGGMVDTAEETMAEEAGTMEKTEKEEVADLALEIKELAQADMVDAAEETVADKAGTMEKTEKVEEEVADLAEEIKEPAQADMVAEAGEDNDEEVDEMDIADMAEERDKEEEVDLADAGEEMEMAEEEKTEMAEEMEGAEEEVEEVSKTAAAKRKRGKNGKNPTRVQRKKAEEDVCFICFDGGELVLCDRRGCPKAYHPACVNRDEAFFQAKGRWNCGWHLCSNCEKNAYYLCYTCTFSVCKGCIKDAVFFCVRGSKGFCETCMKTVTLIERNEEGNKEKSQVDFDDKSSLEYLFKDYWTDLKEKLSLTSEELTQAKNPWKGSDLHTGKHELHNEPYDGKSDSGSRSDSSSDNTEATHSKRRKPKKRLKSRAKGKGSKGDGTEVLSTDESVEWASKELLEFVMHMRNGDKSVCSQFDVQALLLEYIKKNRLRDPRRKSQIICDARLENLFGKPRVGHFEMLKLIETHFLLKEDSQVDDLHGSAADAEANQSEADGNSDALMKANKNKRRKSRKKDGRGLQSNLDDYAAIDMHNINLIYLRRSLLENLIEDTETFHDKVVGSFVRIRISGNAQKQDLYRLVQVVGTSKAPEPYRVGKRMTDFLLEILNLNKTEIVSIDIISNQEFSEDECKRLRQSIKCGLISRLTVGEILDKATSLQAVRIEDLLESEITRVSHLRDRASDLGRRKELRECVEKLQLLKSPDERQRRLEEIPEIHADPKMDPSYESEDDEGEDNGKQETYLRPRGSGFSRRGREPVSPQKGGFASSDPWGGNGTRNYLSMNRELSRSMSNRGFLKDDVAGAVENEWNQGTDKETQISQSWEKPQKTASNSDMANLDSVPRVVPEISVAPAITGVTQSSPKVSDTEKIWHYQDPHGKTQGPFSIVQLRKWSNTGYFPANLRIWKNTEKQDDAILLTDALNGNFQKVNPVVDSSLKTPMGQSSHLPSLFSGIVDSTGRAAPAPVEVPKYSSESWSSETNLPSPTPSNSAADRTKGQTFKSWSPTPVQSTGSLPDASTFNGELQRSAAVMPDSGHLSRTTSSLSTNLSGQGICMSYGVKPETGIVMTSANVSQMHSQSMPSGESPRVQLPDPNGASVNAAIDLKSLQSLLQPLTNNYPPVGTHALAASSVSMPEVSTPRSMPGSGSQAWGNAHSQKPEPHNSFSMPMQSIAYGNWGDARISAHNSASSFTTGNPAGVSRAPSDAWRAPVSGQPNIQPSTPSSGQWGMGTTENQGAASKQGPENQSTSWGPIPGNPNMGWAGPVPANANQGGWVAPGQGPALGNANHGWVAPAQGQAPPANANSGWGPPVQGQAPGNVFQGWVPPGQGVAPSNSNLGWAGPTLGPLPGNVNANWGAPVGNMGTMGNEKHHNGDRYSSQRDGGGSHGGDSGYGRERDRDSGYSGGKPWNRQSSFGRERDSSRSSLKGQRICKFHENGHCKKGASCDYLHS